MEKEKLKEEFIKLYSEGKSYVEIAKLTGWSRTYISKMIKNDERVKAIKNTKEIKVQKKKSGNRLVIYIPTQYVEKLGISRTSNKDEYVNVTVDEKNKNIIIKKHS